MGSGLRRLRRAVGLRGPALAVLLLCLAGPIGSAAAPVGRPHRIVSLNTCADQYLIALADKDQVAALTQFARDPGMSFYSDRAKAYPITQGQAEAVLALRPDLVIASPYQDASLAAMLTGRVRFLDIGAAESFDEVVSQTRLIADAIGQHQRGEALVRSMQARVAAAGDRPLGGVAAHYQRGGYITGPGTLMDDLMGRAGLVNLARRLNGGALGQVSLEQIIYDRPDFLIFTEGESPTQDEGSLSLEHPALNVAVPPARRLHIPAALTICGGPSYPAALELLQAEADRARAAPR